MGQVTQFTLAWRIGIHVYLLCFHILSLGFLQDYLIDSAASLACPVITLGYELPGLG